MSSRRRLRQLSNRGEAPASSIGISGASRSLSALGVGLWLASCQSIGASANPEVPLWVHRPSGSMQLLYSRTILAQSRAVGEPYERGGTELDVGHRRVFVGSRDHGMYALQAQDGDVLWRFETLGPVQSEARYDSREDAQPAESFDQRLRPSLRAFVRGCAVRLRWSPVDNEGQGDQHDRERDLQRGSEIWVARSGTGDGDAEDHEHGAGQDLRSDETGTEAKRLQPSGWHHRQRRGEPDRAETRQEAVEDYLNRGVEHPEGRTLRQRVRWFHGRSG